MEIKPTEELGVQLANIPDVFSVVTNKNEIEVPNENKMFQFALKEEIADDSDDVLVYMAYFEHKTKTISPFKASCFDANGVFRKNLIEVFPPIYRKNKESLIIVQ